MRFRTEYPVNKSDLTISIDRPVLLVGSCFSENMARRMRESLWDGFNPFGALYNPLSIAKAMDLMLAERGRVFESIEDGLFEEGGMTRSWLFGSKMTREFRDDAVECINSCRLRVLETLAKSDVMVVTFGTAWCYSLKARPGYVVGNCHKMPADLFERRRLSVGDIVDVWSSLIERLRELYPSLSIIFTVSPVRHLKDGFEGNSRSKAVLQLAVEEICSGHSWCRYFPAYEILNDDLRDYRFYASDLAHPSEEAVDYIWDIFKSTYLTPEGISALKEGEGILRAWRHRPMLEGRRSELMEYKESQRRHEIAQRWNAFYEKHPNAVDYEEV